MLAGRERRGRLDGVDADDRPAQALFVRAHLGGQLGVRRLVAQLAPQRLARRVELAPLAADAARPGVAPERVDHRAAHAALGKGFELDAATFVEPVRGIDQADDAVLDEIADVDRVRHRGRHAARERFDERDPRDDPAILMGGNRLGAHVSHSLWLHTFATAVPTAEPVCRSVTQRLLLCL